MSGVEALERLRAAYDDRLGEGRRRKAAGNTVVGYFLNSVPVELIVAAGLDPIRLVGDPTRRELVADRYMEEYMDGEVRSIFGSMLTGEFDFVDLVVIPRTSEVYLQLYYFLREMPRWEPGAAIPPTHLFDLLQSPHWLTARWDESRMRVLAKRLEEIGGRPVDDAALGEGIAVCNRLRRALGAASALWRDGRLTGVDALKVIGAASILPPAEAADVIEALAGDPPDAAGTGPRIMIKGSPQSDSRFAALVEGAGAQVVAHDHVAGDSTFRALVNEQSDAPWEAIATHYQRRIPGPRVHPQVDQDASFIALAEDAKVDGVIFFHDEWDDTLGWEYPEQRKLLEARGIPSLFLKRQPYFDPPTEALRASVDEFLNQIAKVDA